jgi:hypothetical protein
VKLLVDFQGFPDGRVVQFEIWRREGQKEEKIAEVLGVTKRGKGIGEWNPEFQEDKGVQTMAEKTSEKSRDDKYYFVAKIDDKQARSENIGFTYPLDIYLVDEEKKPLEGIVFTITFSDGSKRKGVFKNGHARFDDAPSGKFKLELEGCEFVFEGKNKT